MCWRASSHNTTPHFHLRNAPTNIIDAVSAVFKAWHIHLHSPMFFSSASRVDPASRRYDPILRLLFSHSWAYLLFLPLATLANHWKLALLYCVLGEATRSGRCLLFNRLFGLLSTGLFGGRSHCARRLVKFLPSVLGPLLVHGLSAMEKRATRDTSSQYGGRKFWHIHTRIAG